MFLKVGKWRKTFAGSKTGKTERNPPADGIPASRKQDILTFKSSSKAKSKAEVF